MFNNLDVSLNYLARGRFDIPSGLIGGKSPPAPEITSAYFPNQPEKAHGSAACPRPPGPGVRLRNRF